MLLPLVTSSSSSSLFSLCISLCVRLAHYYANYRSATAKEEEKEDAETMRVQEEISRRKGDDNCRQRREQMRERKTAVAASDGRDAADAADKGWLMVEKILAHNAHDAPQNGWQGQSLN